MHEKSIYIGTPKNMVVTGQKVSIRDRKVS